jgi:glycosyltransferase involved in cell wall biosynthesis
MRIGIDARCLEGYRTGVGRYLTNLLRIWGKQNTEHSYILYTKQEVPNDEFLKASCFIVKNAGGALLKKGPIWEQLLLPRVVSGDDVDVFFAPAYTAPLSLKCPFVLAIHDVSYEAHPEWYPFLERSYYRYVSKRAAAKAKHIITDSQEVKREINKYFGAQLADANVIYLAADEVFLPVDEPAVIAATKRKLGLVNRYLLYVGMMFTRRNIPVLLEAFAQIRGLAPDCDLVLIGENKTEPRIDLDKLVDRLDLKSAVWQRDYIDQSDVVNLYSGAEAFVYLSSYEGFGLPVLEAMQCGAPVIVSNASCLPEIAGGAAVLVVPEDAKAVASAITEVLTDDELRSDLRNRGLRRAREFSWKESAQRTLKLLEGAIR